MKFEVTAERLALIDDSKPLQKLDDSGLANLKTALVTFPSGKVWMDRNVFEKDLRSACSAAGVTLATAQEKAVVGIFGEHDDEAAVCTDKKGNIESNPDLRDTENVPLKDDIQAYFEREVVPHVPDSWLDHEKTKVGYEISFNRHFYKYVPPRSLEQIDADLKDVTRDIVVLLGDLAK